MLEREAFQKEAIQILNDLLSIPSVNGEDDERVIARFIYDHLKKHDIPVELQLIDEKHANVIARLEGNENSKTVIWNGHLDTVSYGNLEEWETKPHIPIEKDSKLFARGASDMKSGLAAMIYAMTTFKKLGTKPITNICFIGTCDEEKTGLGATKILEEGKLPKAEAIIIGEPTDCQLGVVQKGCIWLELTVYGKTSHGAYPEEGVNAIQSGYEVANRLKNYIETFSHPILGKSTAQVTRIEGGVAPNMTPDICTLLMDIRIVPSVNVQMIIHMLECFYQDYKEYTKHNITFAHKILTDRMPIEIASDHEYVQKFQETLRRRGLPAKEIGINYFTDASIFVKEKPNIPILLFGPGEPNVAHKPNEYVTLDKYFQSIDALIRVFGGIE